MATKDFSSSSLVSGYEFAKLCRFVFCPRYVPQLTDFVPYISDNDFIFLNLDYMSSFIDCLKRYRNVPRFNLIVHNSDQSFDSDKFFAISLYTYRIYAINATVSNVKLKLIPLGFVDTVSKPHNLLKAIASQTLDKSIFMYMNFNIGTNRAERQRCFDMLKDCSYVTKESDLPPAVFYKQMRKSKYVISPDGTGFDCHRVYEAILFDAIPIIKKNPLADFYKDLPVVIVEDWSQINEEKFIADYEMLYNKLIKWKQDNPEWSTAKFWIERYG
jgi:hypothetical protein